MDPARARRIFRQHVRTDQLLGVDTVPIQTHPKTFGTGVVASATMPVNPPVSETMPVDAGTPMQTLDRATRLRILNDIDTGQVRGCTRCGLAESRHHTVFGEGDPEASIMFIGEGPGADEDAVGRPFVGKAGAMLDKWIAAMGLERDRVYIANVVKCRPPNNRTPMPDEVDACRGYLQSQIATIQPCVIVTLGAPATKLITGTTEGITRVRGMWSQYTAVDPPIPVMPTFHPSFLLRSYTTDNRKKVWSDLRQAMERMNTATSDVQGPKS